MGRRFKIGFVLTGGVALVSLVFGLQMANRIRSAEEIEDPTTGFAAPEVQLFDTSDPPLEVKLFWPATNNDILLRTRDSTIFASTDVRNRIRQIVEQLIQGADDPLLLGQLPQDTRLDEVFLSETGTAYLNFNTAISDNHPGGVLAELATIYSIVNSLTYNLTEVDQVKILIGGAEKETLAGHCLLLLPLELDLGFSDIGIPAEAVNLVEAQSPELP